LAASGDTESRSAPLTPEARSFAWADQIDLICASRLMNADATVAALIGGYARALSHVGSDAM